MANKLLVLIFVYFIINGGINNSTIIAIKREEST